MSNKECHKEEIIDEMKKDIANLYIIKDIVIELKTIVTMQTEQGKKQDRILTQQAELLIKINETVAQQGKMLKKATEKYEDLDSKIIQKNITDLEDNSISFNTMLRTFIDKALPIIISSGLIYLVLEIVGKV